MNKAFDRLYTTDKRYILITGGRGSLKSSNVHEFVAELCRFQSGHGVLFTRYTMTSAEKSIIPEFRAVTKRLGIYNEFKFTKNIVTHKESGSFIFFSGIKTSSGDQTGNLKSISGITTWVIEEGEDFRDEKTFDTIDDSIRTMERQNRVIWIQNPSTKEHFVYKRWIEPRNKKVNIKGFMVTVSDMPNVEHIHTTYHIGEKYLAKDWLAKAEAYRERIANASFEERHKSHYYHNYIGGWLERAEGVIYANWIEGFFDESLPYGYGFDFGYFPDPCAMVRLAVDENRMMIYVEEVLCQTQMSTDEVKLITKALLAKKDDLVVTDTNEPRLTNELKSVGVNAVKARKGKDSVVNGIRKIQDYLIIVCGESHNLKRELNNYVWNNKKASIPVDAWNHLLDAMRYIFDRLTHKNTGWDGIGDSVMM